MCNFWVSESVSVSGSGSGIWSGMDGCVVLSGFRSGMDGWMDGWGKDNIICSGLTYQC